MTSTCDVYEKLVDEEDELLAKIELCEGCQWSLLEYVSRYGEMGRAIGEEIITNIHHIEQDLRTELLHLRLEKGFLAETMKKGESRLPEEEGDMTAAL
ncbi:hypothetical protein [Gorillibacterium timonense]|uniref:hypothetical protein n=1 Tax=Gorillibacterium timonense TaxID=1689269 RepID=UPI00071C58F4|nr:hypothetical protein [Gorillibacterium timonense]